jgi:hypothetical protein
MYRPLNIGNKQLLVSCAYYCKQGFISWTALNIWSWSWWRVVISLRHALNYSQAEARLCCYLDELRFGRVNEQFEVNTLWCRRNLESNTVRCPSPTSPLSTDRFLSLTRAQCCKEACRSLLDCQCHAAVRLWRTVAELYSCCMLLFYCSLTPFLKRGINRFSLPVT